MTYTVRLLDRDRKLVAVLDYIVGLGYSRRFGQATPITIRLPRKDDKTKLVAQAYWIELWRGDTRKFLARVSERDLSQDPAIITAMTPEFLLSDWYTPRNWLYDKVDGADVLRDLCRKFRSTVFNIVEHWQGCELHQVDLHTQPTRAGDVIIARDTENHHYESGFVITPPIDLGDVYRIERIRWSETAGGTLPDGSPLTQITIQTRTGNTSYPDASWSNWSNEFEALTAEDAEQKGVVTSSPTARYIQVKANLYTKDTFSPSADGGRFGLTPILHGLEVVASYETDIQPTGIPASSGKTVTGLVFDGINHLAATNQVCEQIGWEWRVTSDLTLRAGSLGGNHANSILLRHGTNADIQQLADDDAKLVNVLHCYGAGSGLGRLYTCLRDEESISRYGEREGVFEDANIESLPELDQAGYKELKTCRHPPQRFEIVTIPQSEWPEFGLGDTVTVASELGIVTTGRILEERRGFSGGQETVTLGINSELYDLIDQTMRDGKPPAGAFVPAPQLFRAIPGREQIELLWTGVGDYYVLAHSADGLRYSLLGDRIAGQSYLHTGLEPDVKHYYKVKAIKAGQSSDFAGPISATALSVAEDDGIPPAVPTGLAIETKATMLPPGALQITATATWDANTEEDLADYLIRRKQTDDEEWDIIATVPGELTRYADSSGLLPDVSYEYAIAARDVFGNTSDWSTSVSATMPTDVTPPGAPTGLAWDFSGRDAVFSWDPCLDVDFRRTVVQIWVDSVLKRTTYVTEARYIYDYDTNRKDNGTPSPKLTIAIAHEDVWDNVSAWATATATNTAPGMPQGFTMTSTAAHIQIDCNAPQLSDLKHVECQLALQANYGDTQTVYKGLAYQGIIVPIKGTGVNYGRMRFVDAFAQAGPWATSSTEAKLITRDDMQGAIFQIMPSASPSPSSGALDELWDANTATGPTFNYAPTITFEYPAMWLFDMVRFYVDRYCTYYVQAWNSKQQTWVNVIGSSSSKVSASGNQWTVRRFDNNKMVATDKLRITFDRAVKLSELKFWTITLADEILAQTLYLTSGMAIKNEDGSLVIDPTKIEARGPSNKTMFRVDLTTGEGYFGGDVVTKGQVWKAVAPPRPVSITPSQEGTYSLTGLCVAPNGDIYLALTALSDTGAPVGAVRVIRTDFSGSIRNEATYVGLANLPCITNGHYFNVTWWSKTGQVLLTWVTESAPGEPSTFGRILLNKSDLSVAEQLPKITLATQAQGLRTGTLSNGSYVGVYDTIKQSACFSWSAATNDWRISDGPATTDLHYMDGVTSLGNRTYALVYSRFGNDTTRGMYMMRFEESGRYDSTFGARRIHNGWLFGDLVAEAETGLLHYIFRVSDWAGPPSAQAYQGAVMHGILNENSQWVQQPRLVTETWGLPMDIRCDIVNTAILGRSNRRILTAASCKHNIAPIQWFSMEKIKLDGLTLPEMAQEITP